MKVSLPFTRLASSVIWADDQFQSCCSQLSVSGLCPFPATSTAPSVKPHCCTALAVLGMCYWDKWFIALSKISVSNHCFRCFCLVFVCGLVVMPLWGIGETTFILCSPKYLPMLHLASMFNHRTRALQKYSQFKNCVYEKLFYWLFFQVMPPSINF